MSDDLRLTGDSFTCDVCGKPVQWRLDVDTCSVEEYGHRHNYAFACDDHLTSLLRKRDYENNVEAYTGPEYGPWKPPTPEQQVLLDGYLETAKLTSDFMKAWEKRAFPAIQLPSGEGTTLNIPTFGKITAAGLD